MFGVLLWVVFLFLTFLFMRWFYEAIACRLGWVYMHAFEKMPPILPPLLLSFVCMGVILSPLVYEYSSPFSIFGEVYVINEDGTFSHKPYGTWETKGKRIETVPVGDIASYSSIDVLQRGPQGSLGLVSCSIRLWLEDAPKYLQAKVTGRDGYWVEEKLEFMLGEFLLSEWAEATKNLDLNTHEGQEAIKVIMNSYFDFSEYGFKTSIAKVSFTPLKEPELKGDRDFL